MAADGRLRLDGGFIIYRIESVYYFAYGCRVGSELTTTNSILYGGVGPEIVLARGDVQPYVHATAGMSWFVTSSNTDTIRPLIRRTTPTTCSGGSSVGASV